MENFLEWIQSINWIMLALVIIGAIRDPFPTLVFLFGYLIWGNSVIYFIFTFVIYIFICLYRTYQKHENERIDRKIRIMEIVGVEEATEDDEDEDDDISVSNLPYHHKDEKENDDSNKWTM